MHERIRGREASALGSRPVWPTPCGSHLRSHAFCSSGRGTGFRGLHRLPLGNIMGFVLLVLCVCGQVWLLQTLEIKHNCTDEFLPF